MAETCKLLVLSTAHLSPQTMAYMNATPSDDWGFSGNPIDHGFFMYAHDERPQYGTGAEPKECPDDIWAACVKARELGCDYIKFDCDAGEVAGLHAYDHDAKPGSEGYGPKQEGRADV